MNSVSRLARWRAAGQSPWAPRLDLTGGRDTRGLCFVSSVWQSDVSWCYIIHSTAYFEVWYVYRQLGAGPWRGADHHYPAWHNHHHHYYHVLMYLCTYILSASVHLRSLPDVAKSPQILTQHEKWQELNGENVSLGATLSEFRLDMPVCGTVCILPGMYYVICWPIK